MGQEVTANTIISSEVIQAPRLEGKISTEFL
jgi:hypothetical protein